LESQEESIVYCGSFQSLIYNFNWIIPITQK
jgi:hypothetical protein